MSSGATASRPVQRLLAAGFVAVLQTAAAAEPMRLGLDELRAVAIDETDVRAAHLASDWLRGGFWTHDPALTLALDPLRLLRPSQASRPQAVQTFSLTATVD